MAYLLVLAICVSLILAGVSLYRYGNIQHQHPVVTLSVLTAWCFSFMIVFTIPLDVTSVSFFFITNELAKIFFYFFSSLDCLPSMYRRT